VSHARLVIATAVALAAFVVVGAASAATITRDVVSSGSVAVPNEPAPVAGNQGTLELRPGAPDGDPLSSGAVVNRGNGFVVDRHGPKGNAGTAPSPALATSFDGLNFFQQRFANNGNQFSVEPPDQGLCVGNGMVVEVVNSVYRVFDTSGNPLMNPVDINHLFGYTDAVNRTTGAIGPDVFDPSCLFDAQTGTFFVVASTLDETTAGALTGTSHIDIGVTKDPTKALTFYHIDTTRDADCFDDAARTKPGPCFPDYPQIGADANGFYVTTNVFDFNGPSFDGVNIYALPKALLASAAMTVPVTLTGTNGVGPAADGGQFFTAIPAVSPGTSQFSSAGGGTEFFVSSRAAFTNDGTSSSLDVLRLTNTSSLGPRPNLRLSASTVGVGEYGVPAPPTQKAGDVPLAECLGSRTKIPATGVQCWKAIGFFSKPVDLTENVLDGNDSRVGGVSFVNGQLWATLGSAATDSNGNPADGVAWFVLNAGQNPSVASEGMLVKDGANLTFPSIAVTAGGAAALSFTIVGPNDYPSAGYAGLGAASGTSGVSYAAVGAGPQDGFSEYRPFFADGSPRPRWGDYGAAVADGTSIWVSSEYIGQTCTFDQYLQPSPTSTATFGTCNDTRGSLGNWYTRVSRLTP
jgi:hypothetical protein